MFGWTHKDKQYKGPIIEIRGIVRLSFAALPFLLVAFTTEANDLWVLSGLCAAFTSASFVGFEKKSKRFRYATWMTCFVLLSAVTAWQASSRPIFLASGLLVWSIVSSLSFVAGPVVSFPANIGCILYVILLLGNRLAGESFLGLLFFVTLGVGWSVFLGSISIFSPKKNQIELPPLQEIKTTTRHELRFSSTYLRTGLVRGLILVMLAAIIIVTENKALVITAFTVLIAMQPGRSQTTLKVLSRVGSAIGAVIAANILLNFKPPYWVYLLGLIIALAIVRWILLRSYTYNAFFLITLPLFLLSLGGYSEADVSKIWYTVLGGFIAIIASELFVFRKQTQKQPLPQQG